MVVCHGSLARTDTLQATWPPELLLTCVAEAAARLSEDSAGRNTLDTSSERSASGWSAPIHRLAATAHLAN